MSNKIAKYGMLVCVAILFSYIEMLFPFSFGIPGIKIGFANIVTIVVLYQIGIRAAYSIQGIRILLVAFTFGNLAMLIYSFVGGIFSLTCMVIAKKTTKLSKIGVSILGGVTHNIGQVAVAILVLQTKSLIYYLPFLLLSGIVAGVVIGIIGGLVLERVSKSGFENK